MTERTGRTQKTERVEALAARIDTQPEWSS
jgi:hypothetical protein